MDNRGTRILNCTIIYPIDDTSHHELEPITGKEIHKPHVRRIPPTDGLLLSSVYPMQLRVPVGRSPLDRWVEWYEQVVRHCLEHDTAAFPFLQWVAENPFADVPAQKFSSHSMYVMKNLSREVRRMMQDFASDAAGQSVDYYERVRVKAQGSDIERAVANESLYAKRELPWVASGCRVLEELIDAKETELAKLYVGILNARSDERPKDVLKYAERIVHLTALK